MAPPLPPSPVPPPAPAPPACLQRPVLRPGVHVVRRDDRHLQVGVDPPRALVVADTPVARRLLEDLRCGTPPAPATPAAGEAGRLLGRLAECGLLVDATAGAAAVQGAGDRCSAAAALSRFGDDAARRLAGRGLARVRLDAAPEPAGVAARLLASAGARVAEPGEDVAVTLVVADAPLARDRLDPLVAAGVPHLLVAPVVDAAAGAVVVGPFVVPGSTACQRCVDAHEAERDPRRPMLLEQCTPDRRAAGPVPRDLALLTAALGLAVRELVTFLDGDRPATWSATVLVGPDLDLARRAWRRHPHCGCAWDEMAAG